MPLVLPQSYSTGTLRIPLEPKTVGDHMRKRRLGLKMLQKDVAAQIGVDTTSIHNWETNVSQPSLEYMPAIIDFVGYNPLPAANTVAEKLVRQRTSLGLSQKESAECLGVDPSTLAKWERGEREPAGTLLNRVKSFLADGEEQVRGERLVG